MTQRRCPGCRTFYDKSLGDCPECEAPGSRFNKHLRAAELNRHLFDMGNRAEGERSWERKYRRAHSG